MDLTLPSLAISTGFPPTGFLLESLIKISNEVLSIDTFPPVQIKNVKSSISMIRLLPSLFEEIQEVSILIPPSSILCLAEVLSLIKRLKVLILRCMEGSCLWSLMEVEMVSEEFHAIVKEIGNALDILPLRQLQITTDTREQTELLHKQAKRAELYVDLKEVERRNTLLITMASIKKTTDEADIGVDLERARNILSCLGLRSSIDFNLETSKLKAEAERQAGTRGIMAIYKIKNLISFLSLVKPTTGEDRDEKMNMNNRYFKKKSMLFCSDLDLSTPSEAIFPDVPDEFRCPITLEIMRDPVIVSSGHTYDRVSIAQWIELGHKTCPKSGKKLNHMALIPNYALKNLIHQLCQDNSIPSTSASLGVQRSYSKRNLSEDDVKLTAEFLVGKLATGTNEMQCRAAYETRLLAKISTESRRIIAQAGAIPFLASLLSSDDAKTQENAITAMLNLSIHGGNKMLIMEAEALDRIIEVLESGKTMAARGNAAATLFSLSVIDECKVTIGAHPRAIPGLVTLLREGTRTEKQDAVTALSNVAIYNPNKVRVVGGGAVPLLIEMLKDGKAGITDGALALLVLVSGCSEELEIEKNGDLVPLLIELLSIGSPKGRENSITLLLGLCRNGHEDTMRLLMTNPQSFSLIQGMAADVHSEARRKAGALLKLLIRCCSDPAILSIETSQRT